MRDNKILSLCIAAMMLSACSSASANTNEISNTNTETTYDTTTVLYITEEYQNNKTEENRDSGNSTVVSGEIGEKSIVKIIETDDISFYISELYSDGAEANIENNTNMTVHWGSEYSIEKKENGEWYTIEPILDSIAWTMEQRGIAVGESVQKEKYCWDWLYGNLPVGDYRIIKAFSLYDDDKLKKHMNLAAEFSIEPTDEIKEIQQEVITDENTLQQETDIQDQENEIDSKTSSELVITNNSYEISEIEDVSFYVTKHYTNAAEICIENHSDEILYYGEPFFIEKKIDGEWYSIKPIEQIMWFMILKNIEVGSTLTYEIVWDDYYGILPNGEYRIIKEFSLGDYDSPNEEIYLAAEFTIDPTDETKEFQHIVISGDEFAETTLSEATD